MPPIDFTAALHPDAWPLDPAVAMLNHGSFGACPRAILQRQSELRRQMEAEPVRFFVRQLQPLLDESRRALAGLIGSDESDLVFVSNATAGVNSVLRSLRFRPGDELLVTDHGYNACNNVVRYVAEQAGATVVIAEVPLPIDGPEQVIDAVLARATARTRLAVLDHITSATGMVWPIEQLVRRLDQRGIDTLVDGAHAPGMVPLDLREIGAAYYAGNCHKWLCAPKGAGFLHVRPDRQEGLQPPVLSHGYNTPRPGYAPFQDAFDWPGTDDPTAWLCVGHAIAFLEGLLDGGLPALMHRNRQLAIAARRLLVERLGLQPICPEEMLGAMAAMYLPEGLAAAYGALDPAVPTPTHRLNTRLLEECGVEVPVYYYPGPPRTLLRVSAQAYNDLAQYERLVDAISHLTPAI